MSYKVGKAAVTLAFWPGGACAASDAAPGSSVNVVCASEAPSTETGMRPAGLPLWISPAEPGSVHDITAARRHALPALYRAAALGMPCLADSGYDGAGIGVLTPVKKPSRNQEPDTGTRTRNALLRDLRSRGERGFALLIQRWAALRHITADPDRTTEITRAALVLTQFEHKYIS